VTTQRSLVAGDTSRSIPAFTTGLFSLGGLLARDDELHEASRAVPQMDALEDLALNPVGQNRGGTSI